MHYLIPIDTVFKVSLFILISFFKAVIFYPKMIVLNDVFFTKLHPRLGAALE